MASNCVGRKADDPSFPIDHALSARIGADPEVGAFYWTDMAPDIVNPGREEQGSVSV